MLLEKLLLLLDLLLARRNIAQSVGLKGLCGRAALGLRVLQPVLEAPVPDRAAARTGPGDLHGQVLGVVVFLLLTLRGPVRALQGRTDPQPVRLPITGPPLQICLATGQILEILGHSRVDLLCRRRLTVLNLALNFAVVCAAEDDVAAVTTGLGHGRGLVIFLVLRPAALQVGSERGSQDGQKERLQGHRSSRHLDRRRGTTD
mmetsp:Transcript_40335/g.86618  ORF Transcript_40335/g.86618 Transcript_40335/m.86618 type:complete len:203 (-) Transcript_40335:87-695(-)